MESSNDRWSQGTTARIAGGFYIVYMLASVLATALASIGLGDASQVYQALQTNVDTFRLGLVVALSSGFLFLMAAWSLYVLLRRVDPHLALLFLVLNAIGVAIAGASLLFLVGALVLGSEGSVEAAFAPAQVTALSTVSIGVYKTGFVTSQLFFGTWLFPLGYLVYKSGFLPRLLGALLVLDGIAEMIWFGQALLLPQYPAIHLPGTAVSFLAEVGLAVWLVIKGANGTRARATRRDVIAGQPA